VCGCVLLPVRVYVSDCVYMSINCDCDCMLVCVRECYCVTVCIDVYVLWLRVTVWTVYVCDFV
jgi:hypothetical protein